MKEGVGRKIIWNNVHKVKPYQVYFDSYTNKEIREEDSSDG